MAPVGHKGRAQSMFVCGRAELQRRGFLPGSPRGGGGVRGVTVRKRARVGLRKRVSSIWAPGCTGKARKHCFLFESAGVISHWQSGWT